MERTGAFTSGALIVTLVHFRSKGLLLDMANFSGRHVLEIGCGDGRVTWLYADKAAHVTAIEPSAKLITLARQELPSYLQDRVEFHNATFEDFATASKPSAFDIVILSWSLC